MHPLGLCNHKIVDHVRLIGLPVYHVINILRHRLKFRTHNIGNQKLCKRQNKEYREYNTDTSGVTKCTSASTGTASAAEVWGNDRAWLQAVDSPYDQQIATNWNTNGNSSGTARFSRQTLQDRIKDVMDIDLSGVDPNSWFTIQSANQYGWVAKIQVGPDASVGTVSGRWFRENLLARQSVDGRSLRSQCFTVSYNADLDCFIFDVYGYGHGCGMSQWGAIGYARNGWSYRDILTHYFVGTTLTTY